MKEQQLFSQREQKGQVLVMAILLMAVLAVFIPTLVWWSRQDTQTSVKQKESTTAFHLAEAAVDRGRWKLLESATNWSTTSTTTLPGYNFDKTYTDVAGGTYAIQISSDPANENQRIILGVGRDNSTHEVRKIRVVYTNTTTSFSVRANKTLGVAAAADVHWGPVIAGQTITTSRAYPRFYGAQNITTLDANGITQPNSDNVQWWSYFKIPPAPVIDFNFYASSAQALDTLYGGSSDADCGNYYDTRPSSAGARDFTRCTDTNGRTFYIQSRDVTFGSAGNQNYIVGNVVIKTGSLTIQGNGGGNGSYDAHVPQQAWKEYGNSWATYQSFDASAPASYSAASNSNYSASATLTYPISNVMVHGFLYSGGSQSLTGGGGGVVHGAVMTGSNETLTTSNFTMYYDDTVTDDIKTVNLVLTLVSWDEIPGSWSGP
ncbi:MAG: hypothetical protein HY399_08595 [Elusimicrobia bacterium]|nr:hypothetical protein [Elusimicrobiota bacterium]